MEKKNIEEVEYLDTDDVAVEDMEVDKEDIDIKEVEDVYRGCGLELRGGRRGRYRHRGLMENMEYVEDVEVYLTVVNVEDVDLGNMDMNYVDVENVDT